MPSAYTGRPPAADAAAARRHLLEVLEPVVAPAGYDLEDVTVTAAGRRSVVRVIVDADGGIDLDAVADVSRVVSDALDADRRRAAPRSPARTCSRSARPGVDRPLTEPRHWRRAVGRLVKVAVRDGSRRDRPGHRGRRRRRHLRRRRQPQRQSPGTTSGPARSRSSSAARRAGTRARTTMEADDERRHRRAAQHRAGEGDLLRHRLSRRSRPRC